MDLYTSISTFVADTKAKLDAAKADGKVTISEIVVLFMDAGDRLVKAASLLDVAGADKKAAVLTALGTFYDSVIAPLDIPGIPNLIEGPIVDPALRATLLKGADYFIEFFVSKLGK